MRKGTISGVLPMLGLLIMAFLFAFQALPISQGLSEEISDSYTDLSRITQAKSYGSFYFHNNIIQASEHAVNNQSFKLGQEGGGLNWINNVPTRENLIEELEVETIEYLNDYHSSPYVIQDCFTPEINHSLSIIDDGNDHVKFNLTSYGGEKTDPVTVLCNYPSTTVNYTAKRPGYGENFYETSFSGKNKAEANRYFQLVSNTRQYFNELQEGLETVEPNTGYSSWTCSLTDSDKTTAKTNALTPIEDSIDSAKRGAEATSADFPEGLAIINSEITSSTNFPTFGNPVTTDRMKASIETEINENPNQCSCTTDEDGDTVCTEPEYQAEATITPQETRLSWNLRDTKYRVLTGEGWKNLEFKVTPYIYNY